MRMPLTPLYGHEGLRSRLAGAIASGRLPQALLFEGPQGVGKQRLALWLAQRILCEARQGSGDPEDVASEPCGECKSCLLTLGLAHPDVHWLVPLELQRQVADADKQVELVEEALGEVLAARRANPLWEPPSGMAAHGIASVRLLLRRLALTPAMGRAKVFILGDADRLVPQRANQEAANALLKALEEPPADAVIVLTTSDGKAMPSTIRSRVVRVRVPRLPDSVVTVFVQKELKQGAGISVAGGAIGRVFATRGGGKRGTGEAFLAAAQGKAAARYAVALGQPPYQARGAFAAMLDDLLEQLRAQARAGGNTGPVVEAIAQVLQAREQAQGNVNPQLLAAVLADDLAAAR